MNADAFLHAITPRTQGDHHQLAVQSRPARSCPKSEMHRLVDEVANQNIWIILDLCYEQLIYDPVPHNLVRVLADADARPRDRDGLGVEVVRDDRLALRLGPGSGAGDCGLQRAAEPLDVERVVDLAEGGAGGADRAAGRA